MHVHCVCSGSEPEYTSDWKDFILEGIASFQFSSRGNRKFLKQLWREQMCFQHMFSI